MKVTFRVQRYNPEKDKTPYFKDYHLELNDAAVVLDGLHKIKWEIDGTLAFRRSCAHAICGSCAMKINGYNRLACFTAIRTLKKSSLVTVEPLPGLPVEKDLIVDMNLFYKKYEVVKPYLINKTPPPQEERYQCNEDRMRIDEATQCIMCSSCSQSCPSTWKNDDFLGPAALLKAYRFIEDTRDEGAEERLNIIDQRDGVWRCHTIFNCVEACPKEINLTYHISQMKMKLVNRSI